MSERVCTRKRGKAIQKQEYNAQLKQLILACSEPFERYLHLPTIWCVWEKEEYGVDFDWSVLWSHLNKQVTEEEASKYASASALAEHIYGPIAAILIVGLEKMMSDLWREYLKSNKLGIDV